MRWWCGTCRPGDMIRVRLGSVWHYGVYASDGEVIAFGMPPWPKAAPPETVRVVATDIDVFACGQMVEQAVFGFWEKRRRVPPEESIRRARARLGEGGYDLLTNNCEHFARACVLGRHESEQVQKALGGARGDREGENA